MSKGPFHRSLFGSPSSRSAQGSRRHCCSLLPPVAGPGQSLDHFVTGSRGGSFRPRLVLSQIQDLWAKLCQTPCLTGSTPPPHLDLWPLCATWIQFLPLTCLYPPYPLGNTLHLPIWHLQQFHRWWHTVFLLLPIVNCLFFFLKQV